MAYFILNSPLIKWSESRMTIGTRFEVVCKHITFAEGRRPAVDMLQSTIPKLTPKRLTQRLQHCVIRMRQNGDI